MIFKSKILVLGVGQNNFLSFLYSNLKLFNDNFTIAAPFVKEINKEVNNDTWMYQNNLVATKTSFLDYCKSCISLFFNFHTWQTFLFILFVEAKVGKAFHFVSKQIEAKAFFIINNNFNDFDTFHFHFLQYSYLRELFFVPKNKKIVCTFWGSDLLRTSDILNFYFVKKALNKATLITCQSDELKEIILSKYGRNLSDKVKIAIFPIDNAIYEGIDFNQNSTEEINKFKTKYGYSLNKRNILIGHNGSKFNNHENIINALNQVVSKENIHLIVNLNYALNPNEVVSYKNRIKEALISSQISFEILESFFTKDELAISRLATDIFIHMPVSDALSGTLLEMIYASTISITGSWLPYKTFTNAGLKYHEVAKFDLLAEKVDFVVSNFTTELEIAQSNKEKVLSYFLDEKLIQNWANILN